MGGANRRLTLIYHHSFQGARWQAQNHRAGGEEGITEAIKAHEMQMVLYIWGKGEGLGLHLLAITTGGRTFGP